MLKPYSIQALTCKKKTLSGSKQQSIVGLSLQILYYIASKDRSSALVGLKKVFIVQALRFLVFYGTICPILRPRAKRAIFYIYSGSNSFAKYGIKCRRKLEAPRYYSSAFNESGNTRLRKATIYSLVVVKPRLLTRKPRSSMSRYATYNFIGEIAIFFDRKSQKMVFRYCLYCFVLLEKITMSLIKALQQWECLSSNRSIKRYIYIGEFLKPISTIVGCSKLQGLIKVNLSR